MFWFVTRICSFETDYDISRTKCSFAFAINRRNPQEIYEGVLESLKMGNMKKTN